MQKYCYLCGKSIPDERMSDDHVVPKQFIKRSQPKVKGFDYAGVLSTHTKCNNEFGPEKYSQKALALIKALYDENCVMVRELTANQEISFMALNSDCFPGFNKQDLEFFKIIDVRNEDVGTLADPKFYEDKTKTIPKKDALYTSLAVLTKSAAALLVSRHLASIPVSWRVVAIPYINAAEVDFDEFLGQTLPFEKDVKVWIRQMENNDWFVVYKASDFLVYFLFWFSGNVAVLEHISRTFKEADKLMFEGEQLNRLVGYQWKNIV